MKAGTSAPRFIDHIVIIARDVKAAAEFYGKFLGRPVLHDAGQVAYKIGTALIFFGLPYGKFEKYDKDKTGLNHIAFGVKTMAELKKFERILNKAKIKNSGIKIDKYGKKPFIWFDDPDGIRLEFYFRP